jgi:hypothetical protein
MRAFQEWFFVPERTTKPRAAKPPRGWAVMHKGAIFTLRTFPAKLPNPFKYRWQICRDGWPVGYAKTKADAERRIKEGSYDDDR